MKEKRKAKKDKDHRIRIQGQELKQGIRNKGQETMNRNK